MTNLVQIEKRTGVIKRVPRGETPVIELHLETHQQVAQVDLREQFSFSELDRKTVDWKFVVYVVTTLCPSP